MLRILNSFSFCGDVDVLLQGDPIVQHYVCSFHPISDNEVLYVSLAYHHESIVGSFRAFF